PWRIAACRIHIPLEVATSLLAVVLQPVRPAQREDRFPQIGQELERGAELPDGGVVVALLLIDGSEQVVQVCLVLGALDHDLEAALKHLHGEVQVAEIRVEAPERAIRLDETRARLDRSRVLTQRLLWVVQALVNLAELVVRLEQLWIELDRASETAR